MDQPSFADLFDAAEREALILPTRFNPTVIRTDGSDVNVAFAVAASMGMEVVQWLADQVARLRAGTAAKIDQDALDRWVYDNYGGQMAPRKNAQAAVTYLTLTRTMSVVGVSIPKGSQFGTVGGIVFKTENDVIFAPSSAGPLTVLVTCTQTGPTGNVDAATITEKISKLDDNSVACTNIERAAGGTEQETTDEFLARALNFYATVRKATQAAILAAALDVPGISQASAFELLDPQTGEPNFRGALTISDAKGGANQALADRVKAAMPESRGLGVPVQITAGVVEYTRIRIEGIAFKSNSNTTADLVAGRNAILALVNLTAPKATLYRNVIRTALGQISNLIVPDNAIIEPAGDVVPVSPQGVIRARAQDVTLNGI